MDPVMLERLRAVDLGTVLRDLGATRDQYDRHKFRLGGVLVNVTGQQFYLLSEGRGGGGAIDLVMAVSGRDFQEAVDYLGRYVGGVGAGVRQQVEGEQQQRPVFRLPEPCVRCWVGVRGYLCGERALPEELVDRVHQAGDVYADRRGNAVFVRRDEAGQAVGANLRGTRAGSSFKGLVAGSRRDSGYFSVAIAPVSAAVVPVLTLVESPIDALSYAALMDKRGTSRPGRIVSTDGAGALPMPWIDTALADGWTVCCALDHDAAGDHLWQQVQEHDDYRLAREGRCVYRHLPQSKDWNDDLRAAMGDRSGSAHSTGPV